MIAPRLHGVSRMMRFYFRFYLQNEAWTLKHTLKQKAAHFTLSVYVREMTFLVTQKKPNCLPLLVIHL